MTGRILPNADIIEVRQGDSFNIKLRFKAKNKALDVSKLKVLMQVRKTENDSLVFEKEAEAVEAARRMAGGRDRQRINHRHEHLGDS